MKTKVESVVVSWQTLSRVVATQAIVRGLSELRDAMHGAFESNLEFMTRVAEIQSISPGVSAGLDSIAQHVASLSHEFNVPLAQVAEADYQALSNQFTSAAAAERRADGGPQAVESGRDGRGPRGEPDHRGI